MKRVEKLLEEAWQFLMQSFGMAIAWCLIAWVALMLWEALEFLKCVF